MAQNEYIKKLVDKGYKDLQMLTRGEAWAAGVCVQCRMPAEKNCYSEAGLREYRISGICEKCFDTMFK